MTRIAPQEREPLASPKDFEDYAGIPVATQYVWRNRGKGPKSLKVGRHLRYRWSDIETWLAEQETRQDSADPERTTMRDPEPPSPPRLGRAAADQQVRDRAAARRAP